MNIHSYIVRVWLEPNPGSSSVWRASVLDSISQERWYFSSADLPAAPGKGICGWMCTTWTSGGFANHPTWLARARAAIWVKGEPSAARRIFMESRAEDDRTNFNPRHRVPG